MVDFSNMTVTLVGISTGNKKYHHNIAKMLSEYGILVQDIMPYLDVDTDVESKENLRILHYRMVKESDMVILVIPDDMVSENIREVESYVEMALSSAPLALNPIQYAESLRKFIILSNGYIYSGRVSEGILERYRDYIEDLQYILKTKMSYFQSTYNDYHIQLTRCPHCGHVNRGIYRKNAIFKGSPSGHDIVMTDVEIECFECKKLWTVPYIKKHWDNILKDMNKLVISNEKTGEQYIGE